MNIPFNRPFFTGQELSNIQSALSTCHVSGDGPYTVKCHDWLAKKLDAPKTLLTTSCTHALEMSALLLDLDAGDEVIVPSFTFVSTANAYALRGAKVVFSDIREDTLNLNEKKLEDLISPRTKAIVPVHYGGVGCEMDTILDISSRHKIAVIEDNAHGLLGKYRGKPLGTFGSMATLSFHETKNFSCGEGGALVINDERWIERAEIIREKGTDRSRFFRGQIDKYTWVDTGSSYLMSDLLAAVLWAQFESADIIQERRKQIWWHYHNHLGDWAEARGYRLPVVPGHCEPSWHLFYIIFPDLPARQNAIQFLKDRGITAVFHYLPLHLSRMGLRHGGRPGACPVTEYVSDRLLRLPLYAGMTDAELERVTRTLKDIPSA